MTEVIILSGNCFWCLEAVFQRIKGVEVVESGYYSLTDYEFKFNKDDRLEAVQIFFEKDKISLSKILDVFFQCHNPTLNSWIKKDCFSYAHRSSIICFNDEQVKVAEEKIKDVNEKKLFESDAQTKVIKKIKEAFKLADKTQLNYFEKNPNDGYCQSIVLPKIEKISNMFSEVFKNK